MSTVNDKTSDEKCFMIVSFPRTPSTLSSFSH